MGDDDDGGWNFDDIDALDPDAEYDPDNDPFSPTASEKKAALEEEEEGGSNAGGEAEEAEEADEVGSVSDAVREAVAEAIEPEDMRSLQQSVGKCRAYVRGFCLAFRSVYDVKSKWAVDYNAMKEHMMKPAHVAKMFLVPMTMVVVSTLRRFSDTSVDLDYNGWRMKIPDTAEYAREHLAMCECLAGWYRCLLEDMKELPNMCTMALRSLIAEARKLRKEYRTVELRARVKDTDQWHGRYFVPLLFVPIVGDNAAAITPWDPFGNLPREMEKPNQVKTEAERLAAATLTVTESLLPLTKELANLFEEIAEVLHKVVHELEHIDPKALPKKEEEEEDLTNFDPTAWLPSNEGKTKKDDYVEADDPFADRKRRHYEVVHDDGWKIYNCCCDFSLMQSLYEDDLNSIPFLEDKEYFVKWSTTTVFQESRGHKIAAYLRASTARREVLQTMEY